MKVKKFVFLLVVVIFLVFFMKNIYSSRIIETSGRELLSEKEIQKDCKYIKKYLKDAYIAYKLNSELGFDIDECINEIEKKTLEKKSKNGLVSDAWFMQCIKEQLSKSLSVFDRHLSLYKNDNFYFVFNNKKAFYSDIYFHKADNEYFVSESNEESVPIGSRFTGKEENLVKTIRSNQEMYQYVVFTNANVTFALLSIDGESVRIPVSRKNMGYYCNGVFVLEENEENIYIKIGDFQSSEQIFDICRSCEELSYDKDIILDLRGNYGGDSRLMIELLGSLLFDYEIKRNAFKSTNPLDRSLLTPLVASRQSEYMKRFSNKKGIISRILLFFVRVLNIKREITVSNDTFLLKNPRNVCVLVNQNTASASEYAIGILKSIEDCNVVVIGENTNASMDFSGIYEYKLPNSGITLRFACNDCRKLMSNAGYVSEYGIIPDYWITDDNLEQFVDF